MKRINLLCISIGILYLIFGGLKFIPNASPAEDLASETIYVLTFKLFDKSLGLFLLALLETIIGLGLIFSPKKRLFCLAAIIHLIFTFAPVFLFPKLIFNDHAFGLTILGQYIFKNIVLILALLIVLTPKAHSEIAVDKS